MRDLKNKVICFLSYKILLGFFILFFYFIDNYSYGIYNADRNANLEEKLFTVFIQAGSSDKTLNCSGVLLSDVMVATAAHCIEDIDYVKVFEPGASRDEIDSGDIEIRGGIFYTYLESYKKNTKGRDDIGVIILNRPFSNYSIVYLSNKESEGLILKGVLHALGYGIDESGSLSKNLKHGIFSYSDVYDIDNNKEIVALGESSMCNGDSGGPLISYVNNKPILVGIASSSDVRACKDIDNNKSYINIWSRVRYYQDFFYLNKELYKKNDSVYAYSKSNFSFCKGNLIYSNNYFLSVPLWDRCDLKLTNFELFNLDNAVELRVSINKAVYPSFYKSFESKIKNSIFTDKFELYFYSNIDKQAKNNFDYKLIENKIYDNKNNLVCNVKSGYTKEGFGFTFREDCFFKNGSYIVDLVYNMNMMYDFNGVVYNTTGNIDIISSKITNFNFIPPFRYPNINLATIDNTSNQDIKLPIADPTLGQTSNETNPLSPVEPSIEIDRGKYNGYCVSDYNYSTKTIYNTECFKGKIFKYNFCYKDKFLHLDIYRDDLFISSKKLIGNKIKSCKKYKVFYSYSISGEVLEGNNLYFTFNSLSGKEFIKIIYAF